MKLRTQFSAILLLSFGSLSVLLIISKQRLSEAVSNTETIVDQQFNPLVLENAPRLQQTYESLTGLLNAIRDANEARIAQIKSNSFSSSKEEIEVFVQDAKDNLEVMEPTIDSVASSLPNSLRTNWEEHRKIVSSWIAEEREIIKLTEELVSFIDLRAHYRQQSELTFVPFRSSLDLLGEKADQQLSEQPSQEKLRDVGKAISLILNADRDAYQALIGEQNLVLRIEESPERYQLQRKDYEENIAQIPERLQRAQELLGDIETNRFEVIYDLYQSWIEKSAAAVGITDQILDKLRSRKSHIANANVLFQRSQSWLAATHSQLKLIAAQEFQEFEVARGEALATSDIIRARAKSYLTLFNTLAILAFACFIILLIFQRRLVRNLLGLSTYLSKLDEEKLKTPYDGPAQRLFPSKELDELAENLNAMRERLVNIIEAHKDALRNLARSESKFSSLFYNSVSAFVVTKLNSGKIVDANQAATELYDLDLDSLLTKKINDLDLPSPDGSPGLAEQIKSLSTDKTLRCMAQQRRKDGSTFAAQVYAGVVEIEGEPHALVILADLTDRIEFEQKLLKAKEVAEAANVAKDEFLSVMSHELRTPLNPIIGYAQLLEAEATNNKTTSYGSSIYNAAKRMLGIVESILNFTQISRSTTPAENQEFTLAEILQEARAYFEFSNLESDVSFQNGSREYSIFPVADQTTLLGARTNIVQLCLNLTDNALKYAGKSKIEVIVGLTQEGNSLKLIVTDQGPGIPEHYQSNLFSPFTQADSSYSRSHEGLGLGLAICERLAHQAGGEIAYEANTPSGCKFTASFPVKEVREDASKPVKIERAKAAPANILLIEDNPDNAEYLKKVLTGLGHAVDHVSSGLEAIKKAANAHYHAALVDISLQEIDGLETLSRLRENIDFKSSTKSIAVTAHTSERLRNQCLANGFDDFISKPVTPDQLDEIMAKNLPSI